MEDSKIVIRPSSFWRDVIYYSISALLLILFILWETEQYSMTSMIRYGLIFVEIIAILFGLGITHMNLDKSLNYKYRIKKTKYLYKAQVLRSWFWFIIFWQPIREDYQTYDTENIFGAKMIGGYSWEVTYNSVGEAREAIKKYKEKAKEQRQEYFTKKKIMKDKIIKP